MPPAELLQSLGKFRGNVKIRAVRAPYPSPGSTYFDWFAREAERRSIENMNDALDAQPVLRIVQAYRTSSHFSVIDYDSDA